MSRTLLLLLLRGFGTGYTPRMPGTAGSVLAFLLAIPVWLKTRSSGALTSFVVLGGLALLSAGGSWWGFKTLHEEWDRFDPSDIVLDEFAGTFLVVACLTGIGEGKWFLVGFVFFRFFDMLKPFPVNTVESAGRFTGLVLDDLVAACLAAVVTAGLWFLLHGGV